MSNDGTASAQQLNTQKPDVRPPYFPEIPVRKPLVGVYEWLAIEAALMESDDEDESDDSDDETASKEEVRIRRYRPGVTFDLPHDEEAATSADESVGIQTPPRSPGIPLVRHSSHKRIRPSSPPPRFSSPYNSDTESSSRPIHSVRQPSPLVTSPISFIPPALPSPTPPSPLAPPPPPPPPPEPAPELPVTLSDDLVTQIKNHCRAAAGSVDWQELDAARQHLRAALAILEGTTK
ncbi:hypothetical protein M407DRAFT_153618 [Tulasnella calospora MUT 4182]|uniref:Vta1 C-terminal domain-containing protein n=1 Tax=Tulasnella calospora MUT 4182 TaxID=1051891 RepID=A0A0C3PVG3_9AGAM|nr:hypothetical protein M407DRAFT_153618 [Tulasnella calospora MUT 4182]